MGVDAAGFGRQFNRQNHGLTKPADAVGCGVAQKVAKPDPKGFAVTGPFSRYPPRPHDADGFILEIFGKVIDRCADFVVDGVASRIGRMAQGNQLDIQAAHFQRTNFLRDESFGKPWVAL